MFEVDFNVLENIIKLELMWYCFKKVVTTKLVRDWLNSILSHKKIVIRHWCDIGVSLV